MRISDWSADVCSSDLLFAPIACAAGLEGKVSRPVISDGPPSVEVFTPPQKALMTVLSERVMPTTDTPGAIAAGVPEYIEKLLADWAWPDERKPIIAGLDLLDAKSMADNKDRKSTRLNSSH